MEQREAAERMTDGRQIAIVIGRAGTGKSHTMNAARHAFEAEGYRLFVPRELAPDLLTLTGQILRPREDKGSSLRFKAAETYNMRHGLAADAASAKLRVVLEKGRAVLTAGQAERTRIEAERLRQAEELKKAQKLKHTLRPRGPTLGM